MDRIQSIKGMLDVWEYDKNDIADVVDILVNIFKSHNLNQINTPILEKTELFIRSVGNVSDIVNKEIYSFDDKNGVNLSLRPEGTAGVVRSIIEKKSEDQKHKLWYVGPMFRYERPQKGRFRQFNQAGVEILNCEENFSDMEIISIIVDIFKQFNLVESELKINHLGNKEVKDQFCSALLNHMSEYPGALSETDKQRLDSNPLRLLDSKDKELGDFLSDGPVLNDFLEEEHKHTLNKIKDFFGKSIKINIDNSLVRGLDYYTGLVFEATSKDLGSQDSFLAGGRYDNLFSDLGGKETNAIGLAIGLERLRLIAKRDLVRKSPMVTFVTTSGKMQAFAFEVAEELREINRTVRLSLDFSDSRSLKSKMRKANKQNSKYILIMGDEEFSQQKILVKSLTDDKKEELMNKDELKKFYQKI